MDQNLLSEHQKRCKRGQSIPLAISKIPDCSWWTRCKIYMLCETLSASRMPRKYLWLEAGSPQQQEWLRKPQRLYDISYQRVCVQLVCFRHWYIACLYMGTHSVQRASQNDDYSSIADVDALLLLAGDPGAEDEPIRKGTSFQVCALHSLTASSLAILITYYF